MGTPAEAGETSAVRADLQEAGERWAWMGLGNLIAGCSETDNTLQNMLKFEMLLNVN